ncbi:MAG: DUF4190 domain-containing protein [Planctomycetes bacterium]|nr:DUF4190 domain-containing protein [Planctomycetota bacterium]
MSGTKNNTQKKSRKTCKLGIASLVLGPAYFYVLLAIKLNLLQPYFVSPLSIGEKLSVTAIFLSAPVGLTLGIMGLVRIRKSEGLLKGLGFAIAGVIVSAVMTLFLSYHLMEFMFMRPMQKKVIKLVCGTNLSGLGKAMFVYANDFGDEFPTPDKWCDLLIEYAEMTPKHFVCPTSQAKEGQNSYAMNKNVAGKKRSGLPLDVVLLFESDKPNWNQVGGPELLTTENHKGKGCNVLFVDFHVEFVKTERLGKLKWAVE